MPGNETGGLVQAIPDQALASVLEALQNLYTASFDKSGEPSGKAYAALRRIAERAEALGFANPSAARLAPVLQNLVSQRNHVLTRLVLSRMSSPSDVDEILRINDTDGVDSLVVSQPGSGPDISSLLSKARQLLNTQTDTSLVDVDDDTPAQTTADIDLVAAAMREQFDQGMITRKELIDQLQKLWSTAQITEEQYERAFPYEQKPQPQPLNSADVLDSLGLF